MSLISRLKGSGDLLLYHDYRTGSFQDLSGNGQHGTPSGGVILGKSGMRLDGVDGKITCGADNIGTSACSVLACGIPRSFGGNNFGRIFDNSKTSLYLTTSSDRLIFWSDGATATLSAVNSVDLNKRACFAATRDATGANTNLYVDGVLSGTANQDSGTPAVGTTNIIGNWTTSALRGWHGGLEWVVVVGRVLTPVEIQEIIADLEQTPDSRQILLSHDDAGDLELSALGQGARETTADLTAGYLPGTPFQVNSGTWKVVSETVNGKTAKVIECVSAGILYAEWKELKQTPSEAAYGTFEFTLSKAGASQFYLLPFAELLGTYSLANQKGCLFQVSGGERVFGYDVDNTVYTQFFNTATGYYTPNVYTRYKITRSPIGLYTFYQDDVLIVTEAGNNPETNNNSQIGNYVIVDVDAGDKLALVSQDGEPLFKKWIGVV